MNGYSRRRRAADCGFTLIELLVVIAIIGLLSTVVLASLTSARNRGKDASIMTSVRQLAVLLAQEHSDTSTYDAIQKHAWNHSALPCDGASGMGMATGAYATKAREICSEIVNDLGSGIYIGNTTASPTKFSILTYLPGRQLYYCLGSNGKSSVMTSATPGLATNPGCPGDPTL